MVDAIGQIELWAYWEEAIAPVVVEEVDGAIVRAILENV